MSNRFDDGGFNNFEDEFGDFDNDDNSFDIDTGFADDLTDDDLPPLDDDGASASRGPSRTFIAIAGVLILLFVAALVALVLIVGNQGEAPAALTATAESGTIIAANATTFANATETAVAAEQFALEQTQVAFSMTQTALVPTATPSPSPSPSSTPTDDPAVEAAIAQQTQAALDLTSTADALAGAASPTAEGVPQNAVAQTATALAAILQQPTQDPGVPTQEIAVTAAPTALPDTGLLDDIVEGGAGGLGTLALAGLALVAVIFASRRLRASNG